MTARSQKRERSMAKYSELLKLLRFERIDARNGDIAGEPDAIRLCGSAADAIEQLCGERDAANDPSNARTLFGDPLS